MGTTWTERCKTALLLIAATGLVAGLVVHFFGRLEAANLIWIAGVVPALGIDILRGLRCGEVSLAIVVPVAPVAGLSRAAHFAGPNKGARPLETIARIRTLILDKIDTLTDRRLRIVSITGHDGMNEDDILRRAASRDQASKHPVAQAIVASRPGRRPVGRGHDRRRLRLSHPGAGGAPAGRHPRGRDPERAARPARCAP